MAGKEETENEVAEVGVVQEAAGAVEAGAGAGGGGGGAGRGIVPLGTCIRGGEPFRRRLEQFRQRCRRGRIIASEESGDDVEEIEDQVADARAPANTLPNGENTGQEEGADVNPLENQSQALSTSVPEDQVLSTQAYHLLVEISRALASATSGDLNSHLVQLFDTIAGRHGKLEAPATFNL